MSCFCPFSATYSLTPKLMALPLTKVVKLFPPPSYLFRHDLIRSFLQRLGATPVFFKSFA